MPDQTDSDIHRVVDVVLDRASVVRWSPEVEHDRRVAIYDLLESNHFSPRDVPPGPYVLRLKVRESRLLMTICEKSGERELRQVTIHLSGFRRVIKDYFTVCESYFDAIKNARPSRIEALDMARRGLHNEGSEMLRERLADHVEVDLDTARRLFTLLCVLQLRG